MMIVADNLRITQPAIARAVKRLDPEPIRKMALLCRDAGADAIDINSGPLSREGERKMTFLVETVQDVVDLPLILDTTNADALAAGLAVCRTPAVINGISLEPDKLTRILPLAAENNTDLVCYLLRSDGHVPPEAAGRMEAAVSLFGHCQEAGIAPERLFFDPVVAPLVWPDGNRQNMAFLEVIRTLPDLLDAPVKSIAGLSNLTTGAPDAPTRSRYQRTFLPMLISAGIDMLLMNVLDTECMKIASACRKLTAETIFTWH